jgi:dolichol-phosphate mannosyltransferase
MSLLTVPVPLVTSSPIRHNFEAGSTETRTFGFVPGAAAELSLIVPTYNERGNVAELLARVDCVLHGMDWELIFIDDNSPDGTSDLIRSQCALYPNVRLIERIGRRGLSSACLEGMYAASAPFLAVMDADLQHDEAILPAMLAASRSLDLDVVVGTRNAAGGTMGEFSPLRVALSRLGRMLSRVVAPALVSDPMSGFFLLRRSFFLEVAGGVDGRGFKILFDMLTTCARRVRVGEIGYRFRSRHQGKSKLGASVLFAYILMLGRKFMRPRWQSLRASQTQSRLTNSIAAPERHRRTAA